MALLIPLSPYSEVHMFQKVHYVTPSMNELLHQIRPLPSSQRWHKPINNSTVYKTVAK